MRIETYVKYVEDKVVIVSLDVPVSSTFEHFQLVINCRYPLKRENRFQPYPI